MLPRHLVESQAIKLLKGMRLGQVNNLNNTAETLAGFSNDEDNEIRIAVARHPNASVETLAELASDQDWYVRYWVSRHPNTPAEALIKLIDTSETSIRQWAAQHPNIPEPVKMWLNGGYAGMTLVEFLEKVGYGIPSHQ